MTELKKSLARLANLTAQLNAESEQVNALILEVEERLAALNLGMPLWLEADKKPVLLAGPGSFQLGYAKVGEKWRLVIRTAQANQRGGYSFVDTRPLLEAGRPIRVEACGQVKLLVDSLALKVEGLLQGLTVAKNLVK